METMIEYGIEYEAFAIPRNLLLQEYPFKSYSFTLVEIKQPLKLQGSQAHVLCTHALFTYIKNIIIQSQRHGRQFVRPPW